MRNGIDHSSNFGSVLEHDTAVEFSESQTFQHQSVLCRPANHTFYQCNLEFCRHIAQSFTVDSRSGADWIELTNYGLQGLHADAPARGDLFAALKSSKAFNGGFDQIVGIVGTHALGQDILDSGRFKNGSHSPAGNYTGPR